MRELLREQGASALQGSFTHFTACLFRNSGLLDAMNEFRKKEILKEFFKLKLIEIYLKKFGNV